MNNITEKVIIELTFNQWGRNKLVLEEENKNYFEAESGGLVKYGRGDTSLKKIKDQEDLIGNILEDMDYIRRDLNIEQPLYTCLFNLMLKPTRVDTITLTLETDNKDNLKETLTHIVSTNEKSYTINPTKFDQKFKEEVATIYLQYKNLKKIQDKKKN